MEHLEKLIIDLKDSLEREIHALNRNVETGFTEMKTRFDNQANRLDRHAALLQTGVGGQCA